MEGVWMDGWMDVKEREKEGKGNTQLTHWERREAIDQG